MRRARLLVVPLTLSDYESCECNLLRLVGIFVAGLVFVVIGPLCFSGDLAADCRNTFTDFLHATDGERFAAFGYFLSEGFCTAASGFASCNWMSLDYVVSRGFTATSEIGGR